jgi:hypothetical protein
LNTAHVLEYRIIDKMKLNFNSFLKSFILELSNELLLVILH